MLTLIFKFLWKKKIEENYQQNGCLFDNNNEKNIKFDLKMKIINKNNENEIKMIKNLYYSAFPKNELVNFDDFLSKNHFKGKKFLHFMIKQIL